MMFYIYRDEDGYWRWRLATARNQVLAESPRAYHRKDDCRAIIQLVRNCGIAQVHEIPVQMSSDQVPGYQGVNVSF